MIRDFASVIEALSSEPGVTMGKMFGSAGFKVGKQVFAMEVKGKLVVKVSADRASALRDAGLAQAFDPGHERPMKQWVSVAPGAKLDWLQLSREALAYVRG